MRRRAWLRGRRRAYQTARDGGWFWLSCPLCGTGFGGHEWRPGHTIPITDTAGEGICPPCAHDLGAALEPVCDDFGHDIEASRAVDAPGRTQARLTVDADADHVVCVRCLLEFDPQTYQPVGRPLEVLAA